jgi:hypothetical protein
MELSSSLLLKTWQFLFVLHSTSSPPLCHSECHHKKNQSHSKQTGMLKGDKCGFNMAQAPSIVYSGNYMAKSCTKSAVFICIMPHSYPTTVGCRSLDMKPYPTIITYLSRWAELPVRDISHYCTHMSIML